jgi:thioredoxin 1
MSLTEVNTANFTETVLQSETPVLCDFWAEWCNPCLRFLPVVEKAAEEMDGKATFVKLNIDDNPEIAKQYGVRSIPTLIVFSKGNEVNRQVGSCPKNAIVALFDTVSVLPAEV